MTTDERVHALVDYGFTERQARFLVLVMRHSGLCIKRQYAAFAGIANGGDQCNGFFNRLVRNGYALTADCVHNRARLYHVYSRPLYEAIGDAESRYRRRSPARQASDRLIRLDAALLSPNIEWLVTRGEKEGLMDLLQSGSGPAPYPRSQLVGPLPGTFPIGIHEDGRVVFVYIASSASTTDFRAFLLGHVVLLAVLPAWTVRVVLPRALRRAADDYQDITREELASPFLEPTANDLNWYFFHRHRNTNWDDRDTHSPGLKARFRECAKRFAGPRFDFLYRHWIAIQQEALMPPPASICHAVESGAGIIETVVLPHVYDHLSPIVRLRPTPAFDDTADAEEGDEDSAHSQPAP